jgi:hypothetical protein
MYELISKILTHEYILAVYGVLLWQVEQYFESKDNLKTFLKHSSKNIGRSLIWVGVVVVFDDELLAKYNHWAAMDFKEVPSYMYTISGFFIDFIRSQLTSKINGN